MCDLLLLLLSVLYPLFSHPLFLLRITLHLAQLFLHRFRREFWCFTSILLWVRLGMRRAMVMMMRMMVAMTVSAMAVSAMAVSTIAATVAATMAAMAVMGLATTQRLHLMAPLQL